MQWIADDSFDKRNCTLSKTTLNNYFRTLLMARGRHGARGIPLSTETRDGVKAFIDYHIEGSKPPEPRKKNVMSNVDFLRVLAFHYAEDWAVYDNERQRVQFAMLLLIHGYSAARPCSTTNTVRKKSARTKLDGKQSAKAAMSAGMAFAEDFTDEEAHAIRYKDIDLILVRVPDHEKSGDRAYRFAMRLRFRHWKGELRKSQPKHLTWFQCGLLLACPITHLIALAIDDKAFLHPDLNDAGRLFALEIPSGRNELVLRWRADFLETPLLRMCEDRDATSSSEPLTATQSAYYYKRLGEHMGLEHTLTFYDIRRGVSNAIDGHASAAVRNQILGHSNGMIFDNHYLNPSIRLDVQNVFLRQQTEDSMMHTLTHMGIVVDRNVPQKNSPETSLLIDEQPDIKALKEERGPTVCHRQALGDRLVVTFSKLFASDTLENGL